MARTESEWRTCNKCKVIIEPRGNIISNRCCAQSLEIRRAVVARRRDFERAKTQDVATENCQSLALSRDHSRVSQGSARKDMPLLIARTSGQHAMHGGLPTQVALSQVHPSINRCWSTWTEDCARDRQSFSTSIPEETGFAALFCSGVTHHQKANRVCELAKPFVFVLALTKVVIRSVLLTENRARSHDIHRCETFALEVTLVRAKTRASETFEQCCRCPLSSV